MAGFETTTAAARARNTIQVVGDGGNITAYHDCRKLGVAGDSHRAFTSIVAGLNNAAIEQCPHFAVHSGVAARKDLIVAFPAGSGFGKTTLTAALVSKGFDFISDEALVFDDSGIVLPYPKPFALSPWSAESLGLGHVETETLVTAQDLGGRIGAGGPLTDLVLSEYGHSEPELEPLPKSDAVAALIRFSFNHFKDPERAFRIATMVARDLRVWDLKYNEPSEAADLVSGVLG